MYVHMYIYVYIYTLYVYVQCPNIYIKNKTFIIRSYISVSSKPSKTKFLSLRRFGRNRNITPDNKCLILYIYIYIYIYTYIYIYIYVYIYVEREREKERERER